MKRALVIAGLAAMAAGCFGGEKAVPAKTALFVTNDCGPVSAVGHDFYKFDPGAQALRLRLNGEDAPWRPGCDWKGLGFNVVEVSGPEGVAATANLNEVTFSRPKYDDKGALVRTSMKAGADPAVRKLCRVTRTGEKWAVDSCGPDPKDINPPSVGPRPEDATPENSRIAPPIDGAKVTARDVTTYAPDPGATRN
ncbi:MAG TPA: hypothetical protein VGO52_16260 [Hyphomonadaceae bacterium]|jgi:hypothetical protein|nr:hypothetical protein [Hyphomonadaceae bacterium]